MFPIYMWVKEYKGLKDFEIIFDNNYLISYKKSLNMRIFKFKKVKEEKIRNFYSTNIEDINLIIGKNGSGKTNILEMLSLKDKNLYVSYIEGIPFKKNLFLKELEYIKIYKTINKDGKDIFITEKGSKDSMEYKYTKELLEKIRES